MRPQGQRQQSRPAPEVEHVHLRGQPDLVRDGVGHGIGQTDAAGVFIPCGGNLIEAACVGHENNLLANQTRTSKRCRA